METVHGIRIDPGFRLIKKAAVAAAFFGICS